MKRRIFVIAVIIIIIVCSIISIPAIYKEAKRRTEARHQIELKQVTYVVSGKVEIRDDVIPEFDTEYMIMLVALYNECIDRGVQKGEKISSYMEVQEEFDDYMSGRKKFKKCKAINALLYFSNAAYCYGSYENRIIGIRYSYNIYVSFIFKEFQNNKENDKYSIYESSNDKLEAASKIAAKKWCDYMEGR